MSIYWLMAITEISRIQRGELIYQHFGHKINIYCVKLIIHNNQAVGVSCSLYCWLPSCHKICPKFMIFDIYIFDWLICSIMFTSQSLYWRQITTMPIFFFQLKQMIHQLLSQDFPTFIMKKKMEKISDLVMMIEIFCEQECRLTRCVMYSTSHSWCLIKTFN